MIDSDFIADNIGLSPKQMKKVMKTVGVKDKNNITTIEAQKIIEKTKLGISVAFEKECQALNIDTSFINIFDKAILVEQPHRKYQIAVD